MASCRICGEDLVEGARFCAECGSPVGDSIELLAADGPTTSEVSVRRGRWRSPVVGAVALIAIGLLGWAVFAAPEENDGRFSELAEGEGSSADDRDDEPDPSRPNGGATTSWTGTTTWRSTTEPEDDGTGPLLGEPVGLAVFFGSDSGRLRRLDLDTGDVDAFELRGMPLYAEGDWLVIWRSNSMALEVVSTDDPEGEIRSLGQSAYFGPAGSVVAGPEPGQIWSRGPSWEEPEWQLFDLATGELLRSVPGVLSYFGPNQGGPLVSSSPSGGIFELRGDEYVEVADGQLMAFSEEHVLVQSCSDPVTCELGWLSRDGWEPVERATPTEQVHAAWLSPDGRLLTYYGQSGSRAFDVVTGSYLDGIADQAEGLTVSPDGRFVAGFSTRLLLYSLESGEPVSLPSISGTGWGSAVFVAND